jgi:hypothetical protein
MVELWDQSSVKGGALLVALALADKADNDTRDCWPGIDGVAKRTRLSRRQVIRCIKELTDAGILEVQRNGSSLGTNIYHFTPSATWRSAIMSPPQSDTDVTFTTERCDISGNLGVTPMSPKPSDKPSDKPSGDSDDLFLSKDAEKKESKTSIEDQFESWWTVYPKRDGANPKKPALAKFRTALKSVAFDDLMVATERFALSRRGEDPKFTPMASTWLHQERWGGLDGPGVSPRDPNDPFAGLPDAFMEALRFEIDPDERRRIAVQYWADREAAE